MSMLLLAPVTVHAQDIQNGSRPIHLPPPPMAVSPADLTPPSAELVGKRRAVLERWLSNLKTQDKTVEGVRSDARALEAGRLVPLASVDLTFLSKCERVGSIEAGPRTLKIDMNCNSFSVRDVVLIAEFEEAELSVVAALPRAGTRTTD